MDRREDISAHGSRGSEIAEAVPHDVVERPEQPVQWRGKRLTIGAVLALLVAGVASGVAVGAAAASGGQRPAGGVHILVPESQAGTSSSGAFSGAGAEPAITAAPCRTGATGKATSSNTASAVCAKEGVGAGTAPWLYFGSGQETAAHVLTRTTSGGITIRVYRQSFPEPQCPTLPVGVEPGAPLSADSSAAPLSSQAKKGSTLSVNDYTLDFSDTAAVGQGGLFDGQSFAIAGGISTGDSSTAGASTQVSSKLVPAITTGTFGSLEGSPAWWVAAKVGPSVARAEVTFAGGATDSMAPVGGVVSLAAPIDRSVASSKPGPWAVRGTLRLLAADGSVLATIDLAPSIVPLPIAKPPLPGTVVPQGVPAGASVSGSSVSGGSVSGLASSSPASLSGSGATATTTSSSGTATTGYSGSVVACPIIGSSGSGSAIPPQRGVPVVTTTGA
jgi:hypothetical protein